MLRNYFLTGFRSLLKNRVYTLVNVLGLAVGITAFLLIMQYVNYETSYEDFVSDSENIYRVELDVYQNGELQYKSSENYAGVGPTMEEELPEVLAHAKLYNMGSKNNIVVTREDTPEPIVIKHRKLLYSTEGFLPMFEYPVVSGDPLGMSEPFKMAISATTAKKYFGEENAVGQFLRLEDDDFNNELCEVVVVFEDSPSNTHLKADVLISFSTLYARGDWAPSRYGTGWARKDYYTYVQLAEGTDPSLVEQKLPDLVSKYAPEHAENGQRDVLLLQPLQDIHLYSRLTDEPEVHGNGDGVYYLGIVALFILIIAWVNYINLSTSRAIDRGREVGLRKVLGSHRRPLITQFLVESFVVNSIALVLVFVLLLIATPFFKSLGGVPEENIIWIQPWFWVSVLIILGIGSVLSGLYPAFVLSSFKPAAVIQGKLRTSGSGILLRKGLVVFQFATSVAMIIGTWTVFDQMNFMQQQDLGLSISQTMVVERPSKRDTSFQKVLNSVEAFKTGLSQESDIEYVAGGTMLPGKKLRFRSPIQVKNKPDRGEVIAAVAWVDYDFSKAMGFDLIEGRLFDPDFNDHDNGVIVLTESAVRGFGYEDVKNIVGQSIVIDAFGGYEMEVVGVIEDFHQESLKEQKMPIMIGTGRFMMEYYMVKVNTSDLAATIAKVEERWNRSFPGNPFDYFFLDEYFNSYYEADRKFRDLFAAFSVLAVLIGCLGLFGLSSFTVLQKTKEVAIRKVLGSQIAGIVILLSKEFLILVGVATLVAWPLIYLLMREWLSNFPYHTEISLWSFGSSGVIVLLIAFLTVSYQTIKTALANPVDALKYE